MKQIITLTTVMFLLSACNPTQYSGTITYIDLEGGFYGIITEEGERYRPINLPEEFREDGLKVTFSGSVAEDVVGIHMWGKPFEIDHIERAEKQ
ncbi:hypothetical protein QA601_13600 [Chitinispirillales bacterium ANBcel5]|uniref:hypothetical protein n=1 Tax=Cellulosispirillum alkaliphilum TaxID=3039283 RepID=UPI002A528F08|nr:hypothetical protein [Chitinispirillales bacterium ANBcel5]